MSIVGYARVSTTDQDLGVQLDALKAAGCDKVFSEKQSGTTTSGRDQLEACLDWVREGDVLVVTRLDRLARSVSDLHQILGKLEKKQVGFRCISQPIDTTTSHGRLMMTILGAFAEFEADIRRERQKEGMARAKAEGRSLGGRPKKVDVERVRSMRTLEGKGAAEIARELGCSPRSVYRAASDLFGPPPENLRRD